MTTKPIEKDLDRQQTIASFGDHVSSGKEDQRKNGGSYQKKRKSLP